MTELDEYRERVWDKWRREAAWPPGADLEPGMVGSIDLDAFVAEGRLDDARYGIAYSIERDRNPSDEDLQSRSGVSIKTKAAGTADAAFPNIPKAKAAFRADFSRASSFVFRASGMRYYRLGNQEQLWHDVAAAMADGRMSQDAVVVSEVAVAEAAQ